MWQIQPTIDLPDWIIPEIRRYAPQVSGEYVAQLLLSRGIKTPEQLRFFLNPQRYQPASPFEFGEEMERAVERLILARTRHENVTIWGDFDADGVTATAVLWDGLGEFFKTSDLSQQQNISPLSYYIPNRLTESHGLNLAGIDILAQQGCDLIVTCDTGSTNIAEIEYANRLGIDVIVTDHHTLPPQRPPVVAIINPRNLPTEHPLFHLSGVAVAYKLVEALYERLPNIPQNSLEKLLDLVAIGLIADLVQLTGDCRYLAQKGIERLKQQTKNPTRPGVAKLLRLCQRNGDRPTDISFGLGPRINAVSRIHGDARFCVELLTSRDEKRCNQLALETELANSRRKSLQRDVSRDVIAKLTQLDLSTTSVIVLSDPQWPAGILGLVASQIAQEYGRPTILLSTAETEELETDSLKLARGSARSTHPVDLYELVASQAHLLHRFGGHPFAAGLSISVENIPIFTEAINRQLREKMEESGGVNLEKNIQIDLVCTVDELGYDLFQELKLLEPCGMGNPVPQILIQNCWFMNPWHKNSQDLRGRKVSYIKTTFEVWDESTEKGFPGIWWGHYKDELPEGRCDAIVELDFNAYDKRYEVRLLAVRPSTQEATVQPISNQIDEILDWRNQVITPSESVLILEECPTSWDELRIWFRQAFHHHKKLAIAYTSPPVISAEEIWQKLVGIAKYLSRTGQPVARKKLQRNLTIGEIPLMLGFECLKQIGFEVEYRERAFYISLKDKTEARSDDIYHSIQQFLTAVQEERFRQRYFYEIPVSTLQFIANQTFLNPIEPDLIDF